MNIFYIDTPEEFDFDQCLSFLKRSPKEILHHCNDRVVTKLIQSEDREILFELHSDESRQLTIKILNLPLTKDETDKVENYIR